MSSLLRKEFELTDISQYATPENVTAVLATVFITVEYIVLKRKKEPGSKKPEPSSDASDYMSTLVALSSLLESTMAELKNATSELAKTRAELELYKTKVEHLESVLNRLLPDTLSQ